MLSIVTNGTLTHRFQQLAAFPSELLDRLFIKFSFYYLELKRLNLSETYFANIKRMQQAGASFTVEMTPCDEEIPLIPEIKQVCMENLGALCHVTIARSDVDPDNRIPHLSQHTFEEYKKYGGLLNQICLILRHPFFTNGAKNFAMQATGLFM